MKAIKVRIYPDDEQTEMIAKTIGCCRFVYNWALAKRIAFYQSNKKTLGKFVIMGELIGLKREKEWLNDVPSQSLQQSVDDLDSAFSHFFRKNNSFPRFKSKKNARQSYRVPQGFEVNKISHYIRLPKLGWLRFIDEFCIPEDAEFRNMTVSRNGNRYYASVCYKTPEKRVEQHKVEPDKTIGIDLGITTLATISDGTKIENPRHLKQHEDNIRVEQQELSKKKEGTKAYEKQKARVNEAYRKVTDTRRDFLHKLTTSLVENQNWTSFCVEDLAVSTMMQNNSTPMSRAIGDAGWRMFRSMMEYKCRDAGKNLIVIGRFEPSSKTCTCGCVNHTLTLVDREWTCPVCGVHHVDRDVLASNNIKRFGLRKEAGQSLLVA